MAVFTCNICNKSFESKKFLDLHQKRDICKRRSLELQEIRHAECNICHKVFVDKVHLEKHYTRHIGETLGTEDEPGTGASKSLKPKPDPGCSLAVVGTEKVRRIGTISTKLSSSSVKDDRENDPLKCEECGQTFAKQISLSRHRNMHAKELAESKFASDGQFVCSVCQETFTKRCYLTSHYNRMHLNPSIRKKSADNTIVKTVASANRANRSTAASDKSPVMQKESKKQNVSIVSKPSEGAECSDNKSSPKQNFVRPVKVQQQNVKKDVIIVHVGNKKRDIKLEVSYDGIKEIGHNLYDLCNDNDYDEDIDETSYVNADLDGDGEYLVNDGKHDDDIDDDDLNKETTSHKIERELDPDKPFACDECSETFRRKFALEDHKRLHSNKKSFVCLVCGEGFNRQIELTRHRKTHPGIKPYACHVCYKEFNDHGVLRRHLKIHTQEKNFVCEICNSAFVDQTGLKSHQTTHTTERPYKCSICNNLFKSTNTLRNHINFVHEKNVLYECNICDSKFTRKNSLIDHLKRHKKIFSHFCDKCEEGFTSSSALYKHKLKHVNGGRYRCDLCGKDYGRPYDLKIHLRIHTGERPHSCSVCKMTFKTKHNVVRHELLLHGIDSSSRRGKRKQLGTDHHQQEKDEKGSDSEIEKRKPIEAMLSNQDIEKSEQQVQVGDVTVTSYRCEHCEKMFIKKHNYLSHMRELHATEIVRCRLCDQECHGASELQEHIQAEHYVVCRFCKVKFSDHDALQSHINSSHPETVDGYSCDICEENFAQANQLRLHREKHEETKVHTCEKCEASFTRLRSLHQHMLSHADVVSHCCDQCPKKYYLKEQLVNHLVRMHGSERPIKCTVCPKRFKSMEVMFRHQKVHTNKRNLSKPFKCDICLIGFSSETFLKRHAKRFHPECTEENFIQTQGLVVDETGPFATTSEENISMHIPENSLLVNPDDAEVQYVTQYTQYAAVEDNGDGTVTYIVLNGPDQPLNENEEQQIVFSSLGDLSANNTPMEVADSYDVADVPLNDTTIESNTPGGVVSSNEVNITPPPDGIVASIDESNIPPDGVVISVDETIVLPGGSGGTDGSDYNDQNEMQTSEDPYHPAPSPGGPDIVNNVITEETVLAVGESPPVVADQVQKDHSYLSPGPQVYYVSPADVVLGGEYDVVVEGDKMVQIKKANVENEVTENCQVEEGGSPINPIADDDNDVNDDVPGGDLDGELNADSVVLVATSNYSEQVVLQDGPATTVQITTIAEDGVNSTGLGHGEDGVFTGQTNDETVTEAVCLEEMEIEQSHIVKIYPSDFETDDQNDELSAQGIETLGEDNATTSTWKQNLKCRICGNSFLSRRQLTCHFKAAHPNKAWWHCEDCSKDFRTYSKFREHLFIHRGLKADMCHVCGKSFLSKERLRRHLQCHSDAKPYQCSQCERTFKQKHSLKKHLVTHTGEKQFECEVCQKQFYHECWLKEHLARHYNIRPYQCDVCEKSFVTSSNLNIHKKSHLAGRRKRGRPSLKKNS